MSALWVKVCGLTDANGVAAARAAGADAIGFVFAPSVRRIDPHLGFELAAAVRGELTIVAVMRHPSAAEARRVVDIVQPDLVQSDAADFDALGLPDTVATLPVYRDSTPPPVTDRPPRFLYESDASGSGATADWEAARTLARSGGLILAGGLSPTNVEHAVSAVAPTGVDVSSGVEVAPGLKDAGLIHAFVDAARRETRVV